MDQHYYEVNINWSQDRKGITCARDVEAQVGKNGCHEVATPPQFNKGIPGIWSPEHLFTAAVSSCLMTTFLAIAENSKLVYSIQMFFQREVGKSGWKILMTEVSLEPAVTIVREEDREKALRILDKSEAACLISNSIKSKITMHAHMDVLKMEQFISNR